LGTLSSSAVVGLLLGTAAWDQMAGALARWVRTPAAAAAPFATVFVALAAVCRAFAGAHHEARTMLDELGPLLGRLQLHDHGVSGSLWFAAAAAWEMQDARVAPPLAELVDRHMARSGPPGPAPLAHAAGRLA